MESYLATALCAHRIGAVPGVEAAQTLSATDRRGRPGALPGGLVALRRPLGAARARRLGRGRAASRQRSRPPRPLRRARRAAQAVRRGGALPAVGRRAQGRAPGALPEAAAQGDARRPQDVHRHAHRPAHRRRRGLGRADAAVVRRAACAGSRTRAPGRDPRAVRDRARPTCSSPTSRRARAGGATSTSSRWTAALLTGAPQRDPSALVERGHPHATRARRARRAAAETVAAARWELQRDGFGDRMSLEALDALDAVDAEERAGRARRDRAPAHDGLARGSPGRTPERRRAARRRARSSRSSHAAKRGAEPLEHAAQAGRLDALLPGYRRLMAVRRPGLGHELTVGAHCLKAASARRRRARRRGARPLASGRWRPARRAGRGARPRRRQGRRRRRPRRARRPGGCTGGARVRTRRERGRRRRRPRAAAPRAGRDRAARRPRRRGRDPALRGHGGTPRAARTAAPAHRGRLARHRTGDLDAVDRRARGHARRPPRRRALPRRRRRRPRRARREGARRDARRAAATSSTRRDRVRAHARHLRYLASREPAQIARDARLVAELTASSAADAALIAVSPGPVAGTHSVTVAAPDRPELLARLAGAMALAGSTSCRSTPTAPPTASRSTSSWSTSATQATGQHRHVRDARAVRARRAARPARARDAPRRAPPPLPGAAQRPRQGRDDPSGWDTADPRHRAGPARTAARRRARGLLGGRRHPLGQGADDRRASRATSSTSWAPTAGRSTTPACSATSPCASARSCSATAAPERAYSTVSTPTRGVPR